MPTSRDPNQTPGPVERTGRALFALVGFAVLTTLCAVLLFAWTAPGRTAKHERGLKERIFGGAGGGMRNFRASP